jgi:dethiobiotin synthetase
MRGVFVTGTDTAVGKTVVAAAICAVLRARGVGVVPFKPVVTGEDDAADPDWPPDHVLLAAAAGVEEESVAAARFGPPVSPHLAQALAGRPLAPSALLAAARAAGARGEALVAEGVGGLLVPLADGFTVRDLAAALDLPLVVAARPGLGTINHTLLTLAAARAAGLRVAGVVMTPWPEEPTILERSNRETIAEMGEVEVATLPRLPRAEVDLLARAGSALPLERWIGAPLSGGLGPPPPAPRGPKDVRLAA